MDLIANFRKGLASVVSTAVIAMTIVAVPSAQAAWYDVYVNALTDAGVVSSDFNPAADTTRLGFTTALVKAAGLGMSDNDAGFADVNDGYVNAAVENGIIDGPKAEKGNNFFPSNNINRAEVTKVVLEALGVDVAAYASPAAPHADVAADQWFAQYVSAAYNLSIVDGVANSTESFDPAGNIKDAAMSKIIAYGVIASADPENHVRFDDGVSAFSVYEESDIATNVVALVKVDMGSETEEETNTDGGSTVVVSDGSLEVSLSPVSPSSKNIPYNVLAVPYLAVDLTANGDDVMVSSITIHRTGLGTKGDFDKVWVEINDKRVSSQRTVNSDDQAILTLKDVKVKAGETVTAMIVASMDACLSSGSDTTCTGSSDTAASGHANALEVVSASSVATNAESVVGDFPVKGNVMGIADYQVAFLQFAHVGSNGSNEVSVGDVSKEFSRFELTNRGSKDVYVKSVRFKNIGTADIADALENVFLEKSGTVISESSSISGDYITFEFAGKGFLIEDGDSASIRVKGDVLAIEDAKTIQFKLDDKEDLVALENTTNFGVNVQSREVWDGDVANDTDAVTGIEETLANNDDNAINGTRSSDWVTSLYTDAATDTAKYYDAEDNNATLVSYAIQAGKITVSKDTTSPTNKTFPKNTDGVTGLVMKVVTDQEIRADGIVFTLAGTISANEIENVKAYVGSTLIDSIDPTTTTLTFDSSFTLNVGTNLIKVVFDIKDASTITSGDTITVAFASLSSPEYTSTGDTVASGDITGSASSATVTVKATSYTATRNDGLQGGTAGNPTVITAVTGEDVVAGATDIELMKFVVNATDGAVKINTITVAQTSMDTDDDTVGDVTASQITGLRLFANGEQVGGTEDLQGDASFSSLNYTIEDNSQKTFVVKGNFSTASGNKVLGLTATIESEDSNADALTNQAVTSGTFAIHASGYLAATVDGDTPNTEILVANSSDVELARFKLSATKDDVAVTDLYVNNLNGSTSDSRVTTYKLYAGTTLLDSRVPTAGETHFQVSNNALTVAKDGNVVISVKADFNSITSESQTNKQIQLVLTETEAESISTGVDLTSTAMAFNFAAAVNIIDTAEADTAATTLSTDDGAAGTVGLDILVGDVIKIGTEEMLVTALADTNSTLTVVRAINGTTAAAIADNATITRVASQQSDNMYLRKTRPTLTTQTLSTSKLVSGEQTLYKVSVAADSAEDVRVKTVTFNVSGKIGAKIINSTSANALCWDDGDDNNCTTGDETSQMSTFKLYVNGVEQTVTDGSFTVTEDGTTNNFKVAFTFASVEKAKLVSAGTSKVFELKGTAAGVQSDDYVSVKVVEDSTMTAAANFAGQTGNLVWSDESATSTTTSSSVVWFNGTEVNGLDTATTTLQN